MLPVGSQTHDLALHLALTVPALKQGKLSLEAPGKLKKKKTYETKPRIQKREAHKPQFKETLR